MKKAQDPRRARFAAEYAVDLNASAAAQRAGYSASFARIHGARLLGQRDVAAAVAAQEKRAGEEAEVNADRILLEAARIAFADIRLLFRPDGSPKEIVDLDDATAAAVASIDTRRGNLARKLRLRNKPAALALLGRHLKLWSEQAPADGESIADALRRVREELYARDDRARSGEED